MTRIDEDDLEFDVFIQSTSHDSFFTPLEYHGYYISEQQMISMCNAQGFRQVEHDFQDELFFVCGSCHFALLQAF
jgi:hypothetical protein